MATPIPPSTVGILDLPTYTRRPGVGEVRMGTPLRKVIEAEWGEGLIRSWNDCDWIGAPRRVVTVGAGRSPPRQEPPR